MTGVLGRLGYLPEQDALQQAISGARGGLDNNNFASQVDADFARLVLAGQLKGLEEIAGPQKTAAEQQLDRLDAQTENLQRLIREQQKEYDLIQRQVDIANGTYNATVTVAEATAKILELLGVPKTGTGAVDNGGASWGGSTPAGAGGGSAQAPAKYTLAAAADTVVTAAETAQAAATTAGKAAKAAGVPAAALEHDRKAINSTINRANEKIREGAR